MTCSEVRAYLFAFLDNELDAALSIDVQLHLERCHACAREAEIERVIRQHLSQHLAAPLDCPPDGKRALAAAMRSVGRRHGLRRRALWIAGAATVIAVVASGWAAMHGGWWNRPAGFAEVLIRDFEHFVQSGEPLQVASSDRDVVAEWLRRQVELDVALPQMDGGRYMLVGARRCQIAGRPAAFVLYNLGGSPASLIVMPPREGELDELEPVRHDGHEHWLDRRRGHTVVACRRGALVYATVSKLPEADLLHLMGNH